MYRLHDWLLYKNVFCMSGEMLKFALVICSSAKELGSRRTVTVQVRNIQLDRPVSRLCLWYTLNLQPTQCHTKCEQPVSGENGQTSIIVVECSRKGIEFTSLYCKSVNLA